LSANCPQKSSVVGVQRHTHEEFSFESHPLRHFTRPTGHAGWDENPFGEPLGEQAMPKALGR
jgi:hypothetical protein